MKKWEDAETYLKKSLKRNPKTYPVTEKKQGNEPGLKINIVTSARTKLARTLLHQSKHQEALKHFLEELDLHPDWPEVHDGLGWTYLKLNRLVESREAFNQAIRHQPLNPLSHKGLSEVKYRMALKNL
jgi:tetratricopeptide (TPR) repeat protein